LVRGSLKVRSPTDTYKKTKQSRRTTPSSK